jgi:septal ring factor EnvC (AmiA/AmiB activator)
LVLCSTGQSRPTAPEASFRHRGGDLGKTSLITVRYEAVNAMLLNEFVKEHHKVEEQSSQIARQDRKLQKLDATVVQLHSALKEQAAQIRKVSDQLSATQPAPRLVTNQ